MISISLKKIEEITHGKLIGYNLIVDKITTDTRKDVKDSLFIALLGKNFDAHNFVYHAVIKGAKALLLNKILPINLPQIIVNNTKLAFGNIAEWIRQSVNTRIVAITGSVGKTSVKEMTKAIMLQYGQTIYTENNLNNDLGVPMTLIKLTTEHQYAVIEIGANKIGEINYASKLVKPESALVNNLSIAHLEGFGSIKNIIKAKGEIFQHLCYNGTAIINKNILSWRTWKKKLYHKRIWFFSIKEHLNIDFFVSNIKYEQFNSSFTIHTPYGKVNIFLPLIGMHNIENALAASALAMSVDIPLSFIKNGLNNVTNIIGRLFPIYLSKNQILIDDTYNANMGSMIAAIKVLANMPGHRIMVVGDMAELGKNAKIYHRQIGIAAKNAGIDQIFSIGCMSYFISESSKVGKHFHNQKQLIIYLLNLLAKNTTMTILIKSSNNINMKPIVKILQEKKHVNIY